MKRAVLYARVSTIDQIKGTSLEGQLSRARDYAKSKGYLVVAEDLDVISGRFIMARSTFNNFLEMMSTGQVDVLVVDIPDRLGRGDAIAKCELLAELSGGQIEYATPGRDESTVEGMALKATDMLVSGIERINIQRRTMNGKKAWAKKGRVIASSFRPYGYKFIKRYDSETGQKLDCRLEPVDDEAEIVVKIFIWCALDGLSTYAIAKRLTKMKIPTLSDKDNIKKKKLGLPCQWHRDTVHGLLTNSTYMGEWRYLKNDVIRVDTPDGVKTHVKKRESQDVIPVPVPAIIGENLFKAAQKRLKANAKRNFKPTKFKYLLRGRVKCAKCGGSMNGHTRVSKSQRGTKINWHYRCARKYRFGVKSPNACDVRNVNGPLIESEAWNRLVELLLDEERLFKKIEEKRKEASRKQQTLIQSISSLKMQNQNDINGQERLLDLYQDGAIKKTTYLERHDRLARKIQERQAEMLELQKHLDERAPMSPDREDELKQLRLALVERLEAANFEQKVQLLDILNVEFIYHDDTGEVLMTGVFGTQRVLPGETSNMCFTLSETHGGCQ